MEANIKFDFDGYTIFASGVILSPGHVESVELDFEGMLNKDVPEADYRAAKEQAREELINSVYDSELHL